MGQWVKEFQPGQVIGQNFTPGSNAGSRAFVQKRTRKGLNAAGEIQQNTEKNTQSNTAE